MDLKVYALLNAKIKELTGGGGLTQAEVEKIVTDEVSKIVADAPEDFDTLKEMSDWISSHEESAAAMNSAINDLDTNKVDKVTGKSLISDAEIARLAGITNYDDSGVKADIQTNADNIDTNKTNISTVADYINNGAFEEDETVAMTKVVPDKVAGYAGIKMIGGKTVKTKNLFSGYDILHSYTTSSEKYNGHDCITSEKAWGGAYNSTLILKAGKTYCISAMVKTSVAGTEYAIFCSVSGTDAIIKYVQISTADTWTRVYAVYTPTADAIAIRIGSTTAVTTTISEFMICESDTLIDYEPYFEGLRNAPVESVVSTSADGTTETTLLLPDSIKNLPDWGLGVSDDIYNYVDFENGVYHHRVSSVDLGSLTWGEFNADRKIYRCVILNLKIVNSDKLSSVICGKYKTVKGSDTWVNGDISTDSSSNGIFICDTSYSTAEQFKEAMSGVMLNYELATEELIDISDILHPIRVETGGTIMFSNEHGLDVPNTITYKKEMSINE